LFSRPGKISAKTVAQALLPGKLISYIYGHQFISRFIQH
jgi:hypothetical protein